jgi:hypothetical protein
LLAEDTQRLLLLVLVLAILSGFTVTYFGVLIIQAGDFLIFPI